MSHAHESLLAGAAAGCLAGLLLFTRSHALAWQMYGGLMLLLSAAVLVATALAHRRHAPAVARDDPMRRLVLQHHRLALPVRVRRRAG